MNAPQGHNEPMTPGSRVAWAGLACMTALVLLRAIVEHDPFPWWQSDPFVFSPPIIGLTPRWALLLNMGVMLCGAVTLLGLVLKRDKPDPIGLVLLLMGLGVIAYHAATNMETVLDASNLAAIVCVLYVASCAHKLEHAPKMILGLGMGLVLLLVMMGAYEVFVTHPQTLADYERHRDAFIAARGWSPGSFEVLTYERRLKNPEPIAWFGLTNVFASFCAAGLVGLATLAWLTRKNTRILSIVSIVAALLAGIGLMLTGAKGGIGAAVLGGLFVVLALARPKLKISGWAIVLTCGLVLLGVVARGMIGERLGELSLLFRWQYIVGSVGMWLAHPLAGVGPGMFQDQYALFKPDLSPEDVASAHSFGFDLLATLGVGGLVLTALFVRTIWAIRPEREAEMGETMPRRALIQITLLSIAVAALISLRMNMATMGGSMIAAFLLGCGAWGAIAVLIVGGQIPGRVVRWSLLGAAGVLAIHAMIEVTASWFVSGMLWALLVGAAAGSRPEGREQRGAITGWVGAGAIVVLVGVFAWRWGAINAWERDLDLAAEPAVAIAQLRLNLDELEFSTRPKVVLEEVAYQLSQINGQEVDSTLDEVVPALNRAELLGRELAIDYLTGAIAARPTHQATRIAASQQMIWVASVMSTLGQEEQAGSRWQQAQDLFEGVDLNAGGHLWLASVLQGRAMRFPDDPRRGSWLEMSDEHLHRAMELAPHNPQTAIKLMDMSVERGLDDEARVWAKRAIELHEQSRLDPLRGLTDSALSRARRLAR